MRNDPRPEEWAYTDGDTRVMGFHHLADQPTVLIHELLHCIEHALNLDVDEEYIHALARGLTAILHDNPQVRKLLTSG